MTVTEWSGEELENNGSVVTLLYVLFGMTVTEWSGEELENNNSVVTLL
jgi:hypothetical protein